MKTPKSVEPLNNAELDALLASLNIEHEFGVVWLKGVQVNFNSCNEWVVRNFIEYPERLGGDFHPDINQVFTV